MRENNDRKRAPSDSSLRWIEDACVARVPGRICAPAEWVDPHSFLCLAVRKGQSHQEREAIKLRFRKDRFW